MCLKNSIAYIFKILELYICFSMHQLITIVRDTLQIIYFIVMQAYYQNQGLKSKQIILILISISLFTKLILF